MKSRYEEGLLLCPKCGFSTNRDETEIGISSTANSFDRGSGSVLKVLDIDKAPDTLPTTSTDCPKCGNNLAFWWMLQTRSADEATTQFYRCTQCSHTWRNYS
ncbi:MAG: transcription factor S [Thermoproteota archaeon]|nr:transcription factor S [Thermoproteota archaeon]